MTANLHIGMKNLITSSVYAYLLLLFLTSPAYAIAYYRSSRESNDVMPGKDRDQDRVAGPMTQCGCGMAGPAGAPGVPGVPGMHGSRGQDGQKGEKGSEGSKGDVGPQGLQGPLGPAGYPGKRGERGSTGESGPRGEPGAQGPKGDRGYPGFAGIKGDRGDPAAPSPQIAFTVARSQKLGPVTRDTLITFDQILTNIGDGFETYTSQFVARYNGTYQFSAGMLGQQGKDVHAWFMMNDRHVLPLHADGRSGVHAGASQTLILPLTFGDRVWIQLSKDSALQNDFTTFSGFLVFMQQNQQK